MNNTRVYFNLPDEIFAMLLRISKQKNISMSNLAKCACLRLLADVCYGDINTLTNVEIFGLPSSDGKADNQV